MKTLFILLLLADPASLDQGCKALAEYRVQEAIRLLTSRVADACIDGKDKYEEKIQAEADKQGEEESEIVAVSSGLKPGERKVISAGTEGPVVEIIKRGTTALDTTEDEPAAEAEEAVEEETATTMESGEDTGE